MKSIEITPTSALLFHNALVNAKHNGRNMEGVDVYPISKYDDMLCYLSDDGRSGYAIKSDSTLVSVFSTVRGRGDDLISHAVYNGASKLDCFVSVSSDGGFYGPLWKLYTRHGFRLDTSINIDGQYPVTNGVSKVEGEQLAVVYMTR